MDEFDHNPPSHIDEQSAFHPGQAFGPYLLLRCLSAGVSDEVWRARDEFSNIITLKIFLGGFAASEDHRRRFIREGSILTELRHQGICRVYEMNEVDGFLYIAMEYVDGVGLDRLIDFVTNPHVSHITSRGQTLDISDLVERISRLRYQRSRTTTGRVRRSGEIPISILPLQQCIALMTKICHAVQFAHERGVFHRDIKPSNIMIRRNGEPVILDFGIAKRATADPSESTTQTGRVFGTIEYMAPEQAHASKQVDERADVYGIGAVFYQLLTGRKHFVSSGDLYRDVRRLEGYEPIRPRIHSRDIDRDLEAVVLKALEANPVRRYRSARQLAEDLRRYQASEPIFAKAPTPFYVLGRMLRKYRIAVGFSSGILLLAGLFGTYSAWEHYRQWGQWDIAYHRDFTRGPYPADEFLFQTRDKHKADPRASDSLGLLLSGTATCWLRKVRVPGDVRVVASIRYDDVPDGFELIVNSEVDSLPEAAGLPRSYSCQYGGYRGSLSFISINRTPGAPRMSDFSHQQIKLGVPVTLVFERRGDNISLSVGGRRVADVRDLVPFEGGRFSRIGFRCHETTVHLRSLAVYRLSPAERVSPLVAGDVLYSEGYIDEAIRRYLQISRHHAGTRTGERALIKAYAAVMKKSGPAREAFVDSILTRFSEARLSASARRSIDELRLLEQWSRQEYETVLGELAEHCRTYPDTRIAQQIVSTAPDSIMMRLLPFLRHMGNVTALRIDSMPLANLEDLRGCDLQFLECGGNRNAHDLSPLSTMNNLFWLEASGNRIRDVSPLADKPLFCLSAEMNEIRDITPLRGIDFRLLNLTSNRIEDLTPLTGSRPREISLAGNNIENIEPLGAMPLVRLDISRNRIKDLSSLAGMPLMHLWCDQNEIAALTPLNGLPLKTLSCVSNQIRDLSPLAGLPLSQLDCSENPISDLSPLRTLPLRSLSIARCRVQSLEPLAETSLESLDCSQNSISNLEPLAGLPLASLLCQGNPLGSLEPLVQNPPRRFHFYSEKLPLGKLESYAEAWETNPETARHAVTARIYLAVRNGQWERLRQLSTASEEGAYLFVPIHLSRAEAMAMARKAGGDLLTPGSPAEREWLLTATGNQRVWAGSARNGRIRKGYEFPAFAANDRSVSTALLPGGGFAPPSGIANEPRSREKHTVLPFVIEWKQ
jgi:serine/threonine protein kinase